MSRINFKLLVEELLCENIVNLFVPANQSEHFAKVIEFTKNLHKTSGYGALKKDVLVSNKPYWPYADTLEYVVMQIARAIPEFRAKSFDEQVNIAAKIIQDIDTQNIDVRKIGNTLLKKVADTLNISFTLEQVTANIDIISNIDNKINTLQDNRLNYRSYSNLRLAQANDETATIAAEPYLNLTPQQAIIKVLQDFGGYDQTTATNIIQYPAEAKFTQRAENIDNMVMKSIIEISKLSLIFYREQVQQNLNQIINILNYTTEFTQTVSRSIMINPEMLNQTLQQAGKQQQNTSFITKLLSIIGKQIAPTNPLEKLFHDDYLLFIQGKSVLVLEPNSYDEIIKNDSYTPAMTLIKTINDFDGMPGKGHSVYEAYLYLFNNIKKGELPSKWLAGINKVAGALGALRVGMGPVN
jgi:hypothetical protein